MKKNINQATIQRHIDFARKNKLFMRFLKETKLFREYFRNIELYHFYHMPKPREEDLILTPFSWQETGKENFWDFTNNRWVDIVKGRTTPEQAIKKVNDYEKKYGNNNIDDDIDIFVTL